MPLPSHAFTRQKLSTDFSSLKHACPKGVYVAPVPDEPLLWTGVLFVNKGPYASAILRFDIRFPVDFPERPPVVAFASDVFHPLVTPSTTYTYATRDTGADPLSAGDDERLPPGGLSLRHGFPEWFPGASSGDAAVIPDETEDVERQGHDEGAEGAEGREQLVATARPQLLQQQPLPHIVEVLQYMRVVFDTEAVLDTVPLDAAANSGAWHAWRSYRSRRSVSMSPARKSPDERIRSSSPRQPQQQPGGARRPGEWNWQGVWEDRVRKSVQASVSELALFGGSESDVIGFLKMDRETAESLAPAAMRQAAAG